MPLGTPCAEEKLLVRKPGRMYGKVTYELLLMSENVAG